MQSNEQMIFTKPFFSGLNKLKFTQFSLSSQLLMLLSIVLGCFSSVNWKRCNFFFYETRSVVQVTVFNTVSHVPVVNYAISSRFEKRIECFQTEISAL